MSPHPLGRPDYARLLESARRTLERRNAELGGRATVPAPTDAECAAVSGLLGSDHLPGAKSIVVSLDRLDTSVRRATGQGLIEILETIGPPLRRPRDEEGERRRLREEILAPARDSPLNDADWYRTWLERISGNGTVTKLVNRGDTDRLCRAVRILEVVDARTDTAPPLPLPSLAATATGDTKALEHRTPLATLVLSALAERTGLPRTDTAEATRALWEAHGVVGDDLASRVLVLGLPAEGAGLGEWLTDAAARGVPFQVTLHQLVTLPITVTAPVVFVCENPAVLRRAADGLGAACAPLLCTEGWPSAAFHRLAAAIRAGGGRLRYHGDFDAAGIAMARYAIDRHGASPWRMSAADYTAHVDDAFPALTGAGPTPWDPELARAMTRHGRAVHEESVDDDLLRDLVRDPAPALPAPEDAT
ncbi:TIGR02679 family protein [Nocardiopsis lambiniae]|uniref:TIGR02679 family protein n=1 Tax=Nocardiopsis lambiniae TaxID=3075539 RepID=A0ABU2MHD3_9ACTN|nr:TIGR02679 family protein [Nocardiopsis sp. DSM 44743]MDT0331974.1 TIGR02679 family protein [Nocardiopsis sp. DSM 44743]